MEIKRSKLLLASAILGILYAIYIIAYFAGAVGNSETGTEALGAGIASIIVAPHMICVVIAAIFNTIGWFANKKAFVLTGGIMYSVAAVLMPIYVPFVVLQIIFSFVGYAKLRKASAQVQTAE